MCRDHLVVLKIDEKYRLRSFSRLLPPFWKSWKAKNGQKAQNMPKMAIFDHFWPPRTPKMVENDGGMSENDVFHRF